MSAMEHGRIVAAGESLALAQLTSRAERLAGGLAALGMKEGDVVAALLRNGMPYLELILACRQMGCYYCPINWHFTAAEVAFQLQDSGARVLIAQDDLLTPVAALLPAGISVLSVKSAGAAPDYDTWRDAQAPYAGPSVSPRGHMAYTSGTTGRPKGVVRAAFPMDELSSRLEQMHYVVEQAYGLKAGGRALLPAPIYHSAPSVFAQVALRICDTVIVTERFDPLEVLQLIETHRIDTVYLVPIMYVRLLKLDAAVRDAFDLSSLRFVASTGAPCAPEIKQAMIDWLGPIIHETYASSEAGMITVIDAQQAQAHPGSAGLPIGAATVRIYDDEGAMCPPGVVGRIYVRQPAYADFTYRNNAAARQQIDRDGLIGLGDLGYLDEEGFLYICDRESDMVISGGVNIYPAEIEHHLLQYPGVADCAVFGIPDPEFGERLLALIQPGAGANIDVTQIGVWLGPRLARYKIPRDIQIAHDLPRDDNGKIAKRHLRAAYWGDRTRRV